VLIAKEDFVNLNTKDTPNILLREALAAWQRVCQAATNSFNPNK